MTERSVTHATFTVERTYDASPARVFNAFADPAIKRRWFAEGEGWQVEEFKVDFRVGGSERSRFRLRGGDLIRNDTVYQDIVPDQRIIIAYAMTIGENRISASLATHGVQAGGFRHAPRSSPSKAPSSTATMIRPGASTAPARCWITWVRR